MTTVTGLYRYPVKSMQGLDVPTLDLTADGFAGTGAGLCSMPPPAG